MKLPSNEKQWLKEIEKLVDAVYKKMENYDRIDKEQFENLLGYVIARVSKNRGISRAKVLEKNKEVLEALTDYLRTAPKEERDWAGIITFLYMKFHQVLGLVDEKDLLRIYMLQPSRDRINP